MKKFEKKSAGPLERLRLKSGIYAASFTVLAILLAVLLNLIVRAVPAKYTEFDLSEAGLYSLSDSSKEIARGLTQDVSIYYLAETGSEDAILTKLLDRYASESSHIRWERKDPAVYPTFAAQYGVQSAENGSLILVSGEKSVVLEASDLYDYDYSDYYATGSYSVPFGGENKLTAAIYRVTSGETLHTYYTTNHGEQALTDTLIDALEGQNLAVSPLDLLTDAIPDDCDLLIVNTPQQDFAAAGSLVGERAAPRAPPKNGGRPRCPPHRFPPAQAGKGTLPPPAVWRELVAKASGRYGLDPRLIAAVIKVESNFETIAESEKGAQGLMQLMPGTQQMLGVIDPFDPEANVDAGSRYLRQQIDRFGRLDLALAAYNAGPGNVLRYGGIPPFAETQAYVSKVLSLLDADN